MGLEGRGMSENSKIEWTHHTFNPWHGCTKISPGCDHCYAERDSKRFNGDKVLWGVDASRLTLSENYWKQPIKWNKRAGELGVRERVFCASMADVFDTNAPDGARDRLWSLIKATPNLDWLLLTKRIGNAKKMLPADWNEGYPNVWLVITVVNQIEADRDIIKLLNTPAAIRGLSIEPLLSSIILQPCWLNNGCGVGDDEDMATSKCFRCSNHNNTIGCAWPSQKLNWVIVGGESGKNARKMHVDWVRSLRDQCKSTKTPFFFKQWGEYLCHEEYNQVGKKIAGRTLDGVIHDEYPN